MKMQIECEPRRGYLYVRVTGKFDAWRAVKLFGEALAEARKSSLTGILGDVTAMTGFESGSQVDGRFHVAGAIASVLPMNMKVVCLESLGQIMDDKFEENVAVNRGADSLVTSDMGEALEWLGVGPGDGSENGQGK